MAWYRDGTVRVTNGSATITGTGTLWGDNKQGIGPGQMLLVPAAGTVQVYEILRVDSNTQLTLKDNFVGTTAASSVYAIPSFYTDSVPDFARRLASQLSYYQSQMDGWQQIMTGSGTISITAPDETIVQISSFKKLTDDMNGKADKSALDAKANKGANDDITSLSGLTTPLDIPQGGTGGADKVGARTSLDVYSKAETINNTYNDTTLAATGWAAPTPVNGWVNNSGTGGLTRYRKMNGLVYIEINLQNGNTSSGITLFTIPPNLAPNANRFSVSVGLPRNATVVYVSPSAEVKLASPAGEQAIIANVCYSLT